MTLRARVAAATAAAIIVALAGLTVALSVLTDHELHASLDRALRRRAGEVSRLSATAPALLTRPGTLDAPLGGRELLAQVVDRRGRTVARSEALGGDALPAGGLLAAALRRVRAGYRDARREGAGVRVYVAPLAALGGPASGGAVIVASTTAPIDETLARLRRLGLLSLLGALVLGAGLATLFARRALRPVEELSAAAADIERTGDATRRLPSPATRDELGRLGTTLNAMLAALERARAAERRFVDDASHELRTPLTALRGNAAYVARHGADPAVLADLEHDAARLSALLDDLLALAREDAAQPPTAAVRLDELARQGAARANAELGAVAPALVRGDPDALARALDNLLDNARRHGPSGGRVRVAVEVADDRAVLSVTDDGPGLGPADAERAFERFWRGADRGGTPGTGLGLAIVRTTAERHAGRAGATGARVWLELPLAPGGLTEPSETGGTTSP